MSSRLTMRLFQSLLFVFDRIILLVAKCSTQLNQMSFKGSLNQVDASSLS